MSHHTLGGAADSEDFLVSYHEELARYQHHPNHDFEGIRCWRNPANSCVRYLKKQPLYS